MRALILAATAFLAACSLPDDSKDVKYVPVQKPVLDWQKGSETVLRGHYEYKEDIQKSEYKQIIEPLCLKSPEIDSRIHQDTKYSVYTEWSPPSGEIEPFRVLEQFAVTGLNTSKMKMDVHSFTSVNGKTFGYVQFEDSLERYDYFGDGRYLTIGGRVEIRRGKSVFPRVERSLELEELIAKFRAAADSGIEFSIGKFYFGNGEATKAARYFRWTKDASGAGSLYAAITIPLVSSTVDLGCTPETAFAAMVFFKAGGEIDLSGEMEVLYSTAQ